ncbi:hypothetical protein BDF22DRAFT_668137 [Syncephalis plumigaleata]|nr:hypothetical protein BDF22DRAFT_668137 [Syncephalis plumigaleata]
MSKLSLITDPTTRTLAGVLAASGSHAAQTVDRIITHFNDRITALEQQLKLANTTRPCSEEGYLPGNTTNDGPASKKHRLNDDNSLKTAQTGAVTKGNMMQDDQLPAVLTVKSLSFTTPRKKLDLQLTAKSIRLIRANQSLVELSFPYSRIQDIFCLPTPDKPATAKGQHWSIVFLLPPATVPAAGLKGDIDIVTFGFDDTESWTVEPAPTSSVTNQRSFIVQQLEQWTRHKIKSASLEFNPTGTGGKSAPSTPRRYVHCHVKARDGYLFFMDHGLFFGFRKPVLFIPLSDIAHIGVATITSRTFSLCVTLVPPTSSNSTDHSSQSNSTDGGSQPRKEKERMVEFAMIDASDFEPIIAFARWAKLEAPELYPSNQQNARQSASTTNTTTTSTDSTKKQSSLETNAMSIDNITTTHNNGNNINDDDDDDDEEDEDYSIGSESSEDDDDDDSNLSEDDDDDEDEEEAEE